MNLSPREQNAVSNRIEFLRSELTISPLPEGSRLVDRRKKVYRNHFLHDNTCYYITYAYSDDPPTLRIHSLGNWEQRYREHIEKKIRDLGRDQ